jgi:cell wall-associated NlpC family hydrolase
MQFGYCKVAISPMRSDKKDSAEMVNQLVFGEAIEIINKDANWIFIKSSYDGYEGWIDEKQINYLTQIEHTNWIKNSSFLFSNHQQISTPYGKQTLYSGAFVGKTTSVFSIGNQLYRLTKKNQPKSLIAFAKQFLNTSYLWGGKSIAGIDCSGFTQLVFRSQKQFIPRDASQQVQLGKEIPFNEHQEGDLAFFTNPAGKVIHVGLILKNSRIIHASGRVKIDKIDATGILNLETGTYSHRLYQIKRI